MVCISISLSTETRCLTYQYGKENIATFHYFHAFRPGTGVLCNSFCVWFQNNKEILTLERGPQNYLEHSLFMFFSTDIAVS